MVNHFLQQQHLRRWRFMLNTTARDCTRKIKELNAGGRRGKKWNKDACGISHPHTERASCLHYMARSRRQGHYEKRLKQMARRFSFLLDRVHFAREWHLGITLGVCMSGFETLPAAASVKSPGIRAEKFPASQSNPRRFLVPTRLHQTEPSPDSCQSRSVRAPATNFP